MDAVPEAPRPAFASFVVGGIEQSDLRTVEELDIDFTCREELSTFCLIGCFLFVSPAIDYRTYQREPSGIPYEEERQVNAGRKAFVTVVARIEDEYEVTLDGVSVPCFDVLVKAGFLFCFCSLSCI